MKLKSMITAVLAAGAMFGAHAFALYPGLNVLEDDNLERQIKGYHVVVNGVKQAANAGDPGAVLNTMAGILEVGDHLLGVVEFPNIKQPVAPFGSQLGIAPELTGVFDTQIKAIIPDANPATATIIWGPSASFASVYGAGAMVAIFEGTGGVDLDTNACASIVACEAAATDGSLWAVAGFADADDQWISFNSRVNFGSVAGLAATSKVAAVNYALSVLTNNTGKDFLQIALDCQVAGGPFSCAGDGKTQIVGSGDVIGGSGLTNGYGARSDIDVLINVVPEPGSLALFSLALIGLGVATRRRGA